MPTTKPTTSKPAGKALSTAQQVVNHFQMGGNCYLANDITIDLSKDLPESMAGELWLVKNVNLDLNGHVLELKQNAVGNCIGIRSLEEEITFVIKDSSKAGTGTIRGVVCTNGMGRDLIRVNLMNDAQHCILESGTLEWALADGVTVANPENGLRIFNISSSEDVPSSAIVKGGKCKIPTSSVFAAYLYGPTNAPAVVEGGSFTMDPTNCLAAGKTVTQKTEGGVTWYTVK